MSEPIDRTRPREIWALPTLVGLVMVAGGLLYLLDRDRAGHWVLMAGLVLTSLSLIVRTVREALRGNFATDAVATLAILTAIILREPFPGLVIVLMQSGGESLERMAQRRATRALSELEKRAPRIAHRSLGDHRFADVPVEEVQVGEVVLVRPGEVVPVDGIVRAGRSHVDTAAITGEPMPVSAVAGTRLFSGYLNAEAPLTVEVTAVAAQSQYARIVELVRSAQASKAPIQRLADRYAVWFTPVVILVAAAAYFLSGETDRILAVLVVATPCPLILATPVAIISGINRAARSHIIVRHGGALEQLAEVRVVVFDKTGTLTTGRPVAQRATTEQPWTEERLLPLIAAVEQGSSHMLARALVAYAASRGTDAVLAHDVTEVPGRGVYGSVDGHTIALGSEQFIAERIGASAALPVTDSESLRSYVAVDGRLAGYIEFDDQLRPDLKQLLADLRAAGMERLVIVSGDDDHTVQAVARQLDIDEAHGNLHPADKLEHVRRLMREVGPTLMIGDGTNDAPALAAATVGLAVTGGSGDIAAETADAILLGDNLLNVSDAVHIARRTLRIARQSIVVGLGLSAAGMVLAALGYLPPVAGALTQEAIDVAVILNAVRASTAPSS